MPDQGLEALPASRGGRRRGIILALEGPSGVGKTTIAREVAAHLRATYLAEAWERMRPSPSLRYRSRAELLRLERRLLAAEGRRFLRARRLAWAGRPVVADTGFLGPLTYSAGLARVPREFDVVRPLVAEAVTGVAAGTLGTADLTVYLDATARTLERRQARSRETHPDDLARRHRRVAAVERGLWTTTGGARRVSAEASPRTVAAAIARALPVRTVPGPLPGTVDPAVLGALELIACLAAGGAP